MDDDIFESSTFVPIDNSTSLERKYLRELYFSKYTKITKPNTMIVKTLNQEPSIKEICCHCHNNTENISICKHKICSECILNTNFTYCPECKTSYINKTKMSDDVYEDILISNP